MAIDGIVPLNNIYCYSQIIDPILNSKNMYYEIKMYVPTTSISPGEGFRFNIYRFQTFVVMGELLREDKTPRNGYGVKIMNGNTSLSNYDLYTLQFNNDYGSTGINSVTIPYNNKTIPLGYQTFVIGVGYTYDTKSLFYHIEPDLYGDQYGLEIQNVEFPENTRIYVFLVDVDKTGDSTMTNGIITQIETRFDRFEYPDVANKYITGGGGTVRSI